MAFTEFYCDSANGSNLNAGSTTSGSAAYSGVGDSDGTSIFTPSDGSTPASSVSVGDFGSVYVTAGATVATFVGRITAVAAGVNGAVTFSTTDKVGTFPSASAGAHTITLKTGGCWKGPNAAVGFPFGFAANTLRDAAGDPPRVNLKNNASYVVSAAMTHGNNGVTFDGYTTTAGDGGRAIIDGGTSGASYIVLSMTGTGNAWKNIEFKNNGSTGSADLVSVTGTNTYFFRCVFHDCKGGGLLVNGGVGRLDECEFYNCNTSNTADRGGVRIGSSSGHRFDRCIFHDNSGSNNDGVNYVSGSAPMEFRDCVFETNGRNGFRLSNGPGSASFFGCDFYNNGASGAFLQNSTTTNQIAVIENCNFVKNGTGGTGYGIEVSGSTNLYIGRVSTCGFGSGTQANTTGQMSIPAAHPLVVSNSVSYASGVTPWVDPANGDFRVNLATAKGAGRGTFLQTASSYAGTIAYPDIGAAQHLESAAGGGGSVIGSSVIGRGVLV